MSKMLEMHYVLVSTIKQWTEFHQTLFIGVLEDNDKPVRF